MNEISFVIAPDEFGIGIREAVEPVIDGVSMVDVLKQAEGEVLHLGLTEIDQALSELQSLPPPGTSRKVRVGGCLCGDDDCTNATATVSATSDTVTWSDIEGHFRTYPEAGPFVFDRARYLSSVMGALRSEHPVREEIDIDKLAAAMPNDHAAWLRAMTMAFGRDFFTPYEPELPRNIAARGAAAFAEAGIPISDETVREWARRRGFADDAVEQYVTWFHELTD
jgi:hypothetical protein